MKYVYVMKCFDTASWNSADAIIAFGTEKEARKFCQTNERNGMLYSWDRVILGKMKPPYPKKPKQITIAP